MWTIHLHFQPANAVQIALATFCRTLLRELQHESSSNYVPNLTPTRLFCEVLAVIDRVAEKNTSKVTYEAREENDTVVVLARTIHADRDFLTIERKDQQT